MLSIVLLSGCLNQRIIEDPDEVKKLHEQENVTLELWHTYSEEETRIFEQEVVPRFHALHPDIQIKPVRVSHTRELRSTLIARATSHKTPDIIRMDIVWVPQFAHLGVLYPVSSFPDFDEVKQSLHPVALETNMYEGVYYGIPLNINTKTAVYNKLLLKTAGYSEPPDTIQELFQIAEQRNYVIGMASVEPWYSLPYFYALGGKLTDPDFKQASGYFNHPDSVRAIDEMVRLHQAGVLGPDMFSRTADLWGGILSNRIFMIDAGPWFFSIQQSQPADRLKLDKVISVPFPNQSLDTSILGGENLVISKGTKFAEEAWTFLKWMAEEEAQMLMASTGILPTHMETAEKLHEDAEKMSYVQSYMDALDHAFLRPPVINWEQIDEVYVTYLTHIFQGEMETEAALTEAAQKMDQLLQVEP
ncbi:extracellular solute-binding protein [Marinicrinis sediminis]|uniref:Extracellular solute-binding protein n=1 Tax=Marinicrinis sediminis TaxID=1652465 RepID=A0ABW5R9R4_9BACL